MQLGDYFEDLSACPCKSSFSGFPWEALQKNGELFNFDKSVIDGDVHKSVIISGVVKIGAGTKISPYVVIEGPVIIGENCVVRPFALIRPGTIIGNNCVVGNGSEVKNAIVFNEAKIASQAFVGDSVLGKGARIGSGTLLANRRFDQQDIYLKVDGKKVFSGSDKFGAIIGDFVRLGGNCVTMPGTLIGKHTWISPHCSIGGSISGEKLVKPRRSYEILDKERKVLSSLDKEGKV